MTQLFLPSSKYQSKAAGAHYSFDSVHKMLCIYEPSYGKSPQLSVSSDPGKFKNHCCRGKIISIVFKYPSSLSYSSLVCDVGCSVFRIITGERFLLLLFLVNHLLFILTNHLTCQSNYLFFSICCFFL